MEKAGVISARDPEEVLDYTRTFLNLPPLKGKRIGVITFTGAGGIILIDSLLDCGLELAESGSRHPSADQGPLPALDADRQSSGYLAGPDEKRPGIYL